MLRCLRALLRMIEVVLAAEEKKIRGKRYRASQSNAIKKKSANPEVAERGRLFSVGLVQLIGRIRMTTVFKDTER
jgi:hypothetical protein